jgi:hypothetical protein
MPFCAASDSLRNSSWRESGPVARFVTRLLLQRIEVEPYHDQKIIGFTVYPAGRN